MSRMSELDHDLQTVRAITGDGEPTTIEEMAQHSIAARINSVIADLDELCKLAANAETVDLIEAEAPSIGMIVARAQLVGALLAARKPSRLISLVRQ